MGPAAPASAKPAVKDGDDSHPSCPQGVFCSLTRNSLLQAAQHCPSAHTWLEGVLLRQLSAGCGPPAWFWGPYQPCPLQTAMARWPGPLPFPGTFLRAIFSMRRSQEALAQTMPSLQAQPKCSMLSSLQQYICKLQHAIKMSSNLERCRSHCT